MRANALALTAPTAPATAAPKKLFLVQIGLVDLDVGLALQARQIGIEQLVPDLVPDATVECLQSLRIRRRRRNHLQDLVDRKRAALGGSSDVCRQLACVHLE